MTKALPVLSLNCFQIMTRHFFLPKRWVQRTRKLGIWAFLFFLIKGLIWLGIAAWGLYKVS